MTIILLPKNSRMPEIPLSKVQRALKCEFCWSDVLTRQSASQFPFLQKDEERSEPNSTEHTVEIKRKCELINTHKLLRA